MVYTEQQVTDLLSGLMSELMDSSMQAFTDCWENKNIPQGKAIMALGGATVIVAFADSLKKRLPGTNIKDLKHAKLLLHDATCQLLNEGII